MLFNLLENKEAKKEKSPGKQAKNVATIINSSITQDILVLQVQVFLDYNISLNFYWLCMSNNCTYCFKF